ncbi:siderophore ABC transporter substrate-binding protein [Demequina pelophila]|uniref:siderophore ABC transporter substrate-binding protein n=1 Tax=Demequina pelophila TaxID=1638984 RepID=UPI0007827301|nr:ABC transporter substrate-binding protein [Demequina pelophila]
MSLARLPRASALALLATLALAACASGEATTAADAADAAATTESAAQETTTEAADTAETTETAAEVTVATATGDVTVPTNPTRVVVFEHAILDTLDTLGLGDAVVVIPHHAMPGYLEPYTETTTNGGTLFEPDYEAINAAEPDLIIVGGRSAETLPEMEKIAPAIDLSFDRGTDAFLASLDRNVATVGAIFDVAEEADAALAAIEEEAAAIKADAADAGTGLVLLTTGGKVSAYGAAEDGRFDFFYTWLGVEPATDQIAIDTHGDAVSYEYIAEVDPDMIVVLDRDAAIGREGDSAQVLMDNALVNGTSAGQTGAIAFVDTPSWYLSFGGLTALDTVLDEVAELVG